MVHSRVRSLVAGFGLGLFALAPGCRHPEPDPRDFIITDIPAMAADARTSDVVQTSAVQTKEKEPAKPDAKADPLIRTPEIPPELPGADTPPLTKAAGKDKDGFPELPPLPADPPPAPSETGKPLTLVELEQIALSTNPAIRQAAADVEAARGRATQAGLYPNPELGWAADQMNSGEGVQTRGQQGGYVAFVIKTAGKLQLARLVSLMEYYNAQVALRRAQIDLVNQVRANYFAVLVARESVAVNGALARFTEDLYKTQQGLAKVEQALYEPLQSFAFALQARGAAIQARNRYAAAWRQLTASLGRPEMPPTELAGRADAPAPAFAYEQLRDRTLGTHTDLQTAQNAILQARYNLRLAEVTPIPDITTSITVQRDWSTPPFNTQVSIMAGGPIPVFDRNQGTILAAKAQVARAIDQVPRARNDLSARLAQAFEAYDNARVLVEYYRDRLIPNQVRVYRAVYQRYQVAEAGQLNYNDVLNAQQNLGGSVAAYLTALGSLWTAVVELASVAQLDELYLPPQAADDCRLEQVLDPAAISPLPPVPVPEIPAPRPAPPEEVSSAFVGPPRP